MQGGIMRRILPLLSCLVLLSAAPLAVADHPDGATQADIRALQREVNRLDDSLSRLDDRSSRASEFRRREEEIRDDLTSLSAQVRRHQQDESAGLGASKADVDALRDSIIDLRNDIDAAGGYRDERPISGRASIPDGTRIQVRLEETISSKTARREDQVTATIAEPIRVDGRVVVPAGQVVTGTVRDVEGAERASRGGRLDLSFGTLETTDGRRVRIPARVVSVEEQGLDKKKAGLGAIVGGILGAVVDGTQGALIGAVLGGGGAVVADRGDDVQLPAGTVLTLRLEEPVSIARNTSGS
jgi:hypothetical protein